MQECALAEGTIVAAGSSISKDSSYSGRGRPSVWLSHRPLRSLRFPRLQKGKKIAMIKPPLAWSRASGILIVFSVALLFATLLRANDPPWKGKPYQQWDEQDIQRIFTDSPWTRTAAITRNWLPITGKDLPNDQLTGRDRGLPSTLGSSSETSAGGELNFFVFWASSRVMRAAYARRAILHGGRKDVDVERYANESQGELQIVVQSADMAPFFRNDEKFFQANAFLEMRKSKQRISPSHVLYKRDQNGVLVTSAVFFFPKKTASGDPTISSDEKNVDFICKIEGSVLRVGFEPQKMADQSGPDL